MDNSSNVALVAGVTGIAGLNLARHLISDKATRPWKVYGLSRRKPSYLDEEIHHISCDLLKTDDCKNKLGALKDVTHLFIATWLNAGSEEENIKVNEAMTANLVDNVKSKLSHVVLVTGTKHYMGPFESFADCEMQTPFKESQGRLPYSNFYYNQEDVIFERAEKRGFTWSVARPHTILGFAPGNQMNLGTALAVYATVCKYTNEPFVFPGARKCLDIFLDSTDVNLLAEHLEWEATSPEAQNEAFNVVNGDIFRWKRLWEVIAEYFGLKVGEHSGKPMDMIQWVESHAAVWDEIVKKYDLQKVALSGLVSGWHVDVDLGREVSCPTDMSKSREKGFLRYQDTEKSYTKLFDYLKKLKYIA